MSYRVFWSPDSELALERILMAAADPLPIAAAAREIDRQLVSGAGSFGKSRYENVRVAFATPLAVQFEVHHDVQTAIVFGVWRTDRKRR